MEKDEGKNRTGVQERKNVEEKESESIILKKLTLPKWKRGNIQSLGKENNILLSYNSPVVLSDYEKKRRKDNYL